MIQSTQARLIRVLSALALCTAPVAGAWAEGARDPLTGFIDNLLGRKQPTLQAEPQDAAPEAPAPPGAAAPQPPRSAGHPLPPRRPADLGIASAPAAPAPVPTSAPAAAAAAQNAAQARPSAPGALVPPALPATPQAALERVNAFLNGYDSMTGRFIQFSADGRRAEGTLYVQRPGRLRFQYNPPSTLEIVADGRSVAVRDKKLNTNDVYSIGQTPLKFLLKDRIDLATDTKVLNVVNNPDGVVRVVLEDSSTLGGTSRITLMFDAKANVLKQWTVLDPQGYETSVALYDLDIRKRAN
ncbi:outer membrane lipoprotein carrier protein LolA [Chelatococcus sp. SYSU_G07232]|uniref:Outer membrane lipoprotein carrier protein LolA n=1 Tax=Chelatococcus albus TaxID=3047466 RepID=A0ABT7AJZ9_9HYPH|nr:outer membrane lipoprotein carrier protein LolA [Chelatococcus sp. SYSU_G07232]MDJ1159692.1 outer membrane lipoprotein carrier protein LolA [Chelatococcus sp. SYSU_G07232]